MGEAVTSKLAQSLVQDLLLLGASEEPISLYVNSPGGEVHSGFAIFDAIGHIQAPVKVICTGLCASIATVICAAVPKERRLALPHANFLIHQPLLSGQVYGQASDLEITALQILKTRSRINRILAEACGQEVERLEKDGERDCWLSAEEALDYGLIGKILQPGEHA